MKEKISQAFIKNIKQKKFNLPAFKENASSDWIRNSSRLNCLKLDITIPYESFQQEIKNIPRELFVNHRDESYENNIGWKSFALHGKSYDSTREDSYYNDNRPMVWTFEAQTYCPKMINYFQTQWPCNEFFRIRIMLLEPQGKINIHKDGELPGSLSAVNIAITQPSNCYFYLDNFGVVPFEPGLAFLLNVSNLHTIVNDSDQDRYHIIVHHKKLTKEIDYLIETSYNKLYASKTNNSRRS